MRIAKGASLIGWRVGLLLLFPVVLAYRMLAAAWFIVFWALDQLMVSIRRAMGHVLRMGSETTKPTESKTTDGVQSASSMKFAMPHPRWIAVCAAGLRAIHFPLSILLWLNIYCFALRPQRRFLSAFLASRCIVDGAGYLDKDNRFWVSARASTVNCTIGFGSYGRACPLFRCDSWLRGLCVGSLWSFGNYFKLFAARQRVEIAIGDSGMCEQSQYVRLGSTALVLDLVEKANPKVPLLRNPINAIGRFARDWMLLTSAPDRTNRQWTSLDIQHAYAAAVRQMLQSKQNVPIEAWKILDQWQSTLNQLHPTDDEANLPRTMLGRIDWLSKLWLLHQTDADATWQTRKKIDLRYHELSNRGYHHRLSDSLNLAPIVHPSDISRSRRTPPMGSPASQRGYLIREFADPECNLHVDWDHAQFFFEGKSRKVRFEET